MKYTGVIIPAIIEDKILFNIFSQQQAHRLRYVTLQKSLEIHEQDRSGALRPRAVPTALLGPL